MVAIGGDTDQNQMANEINEIHICTIGDKSIHPGFFTPSIRQAPFTRGESQWNKMDLEGGGVGVGGCFGREGGSEG